MYRIVFISLLSLHLISCVQSYIVPRATVHIDFPHPNNISEAKSKVETFLISKVFVDIGMDEEMLKLYKWSKSNEKSKSVNGLQDIQINRIYRTSTYKNKTLNIDVRIIDYSDITIKKRFVNYSNSESEVTDLPSLELNIYNYRPSGFSVQAHEFYHALISYVNSINNANPHVIFSPPETNQSEYYQVKIVNLILFAFWWGVTYSVSLYLFTTIVMKLASRVKLTTKFKRLLFIIFGTSLCTPLPFPFSIFSIISLPSIFAIPAIGSDYFSTVQAYAIPSFIVSFILCVLISIIRIKKISEI